jgi:hypothetical protein
LQISSQTRMLTAPSRPTAACCCIAAKCVMHKLDNTIKAAALKAADQEEVRELVAVGIPTLRSC